MGTPSLRKFREMIFLPLIGEVVLVLVQGGFLQKVLRSLQKFFSPCTNRHDLQACIDEGNGKGDLPRPFFSAPAVSESFGFAFFKRQGLVFKQK